MTNLTPKGVLAMGPWDVRGAKKETKGIQWAHFLQSVLCLNI